MNDESSGFWFGMACFETGIQWIPGWKREVRGAGRDAGGSRGGYANGDLRSGGAENRVLAKLASMLSNVAAYLLGDVLANTLKKTL